jgi:hypothetical protein
MAVGTLSFPKEWQDWTNLVLGIWICVSPWVLQLDAEQPATRIAVAVGFLIIVFEVFTFYALRTLEELINIILGAWLMIMPWVIGTTTRLATLDFLVSGFLVVALAVYEIWDARRQSTGRT